MTVRQEAGGDLLFAQQTLQLGLRAGVPAGLLLRRRLVERRAGRQLLDQEQDFVVVHGVDHGPGGAECLAVVTQVEFQIGEVVAGGQVLGVPAEDAFGEGGEIVEIGVGLVAEGDAGWTADEGAERLLELDDVAVEHGLGLDQGGWGDHQADGLEESQPGLVGKELGVAFGHGYLFRTPTGLYPTAQGKRSATLGMRRTRFEP